ncbi:hypothetical protein MHPYR_170001 [uncultured Mycobacterium sp.]|uniref:Uncharacterized protein n=1 Tax=uncultured Mycobacterium sp. TaxID=171292 RepID=A0A1Y5P3Z8_9MYCO|nr:hypothetical protein MHPYR_170001 [uncultured Mycobacterium sp.]
MPVKYFTSAAELGGQVAMSLVNLVDAQPGIGWVRGDTVLSGEAEREILTLRAQLAEAKEKSQTLVAEKNQQIDPATLVGGEDLVNVALRVYSGNWNDDTSMWVRSKVSWNDILGTIGPALIDEATEDEVESKLELCIYLGDMGEKDNEAVTQVKNRQLSMQKRDFETIIVHLRALGLIESGTRKRVPSDTNKYLRLTPLGQQKLSALKAIKRGAKKNPEKNTLSKAPVKATAKKAAEKIPAKKTPAQRRSSATK